MLSERRAERSLPSRPFFETVFMVRRYSSSVLALAACLAAGPAFAAELTDEPLGAVAGVPAAKECSPAEAPCVQLWGSMPAEERARLWPFLDESSKMSYWRGMTLEERRQLRMCLSERDREALRRRFSFDARNGRELARPKLCGEERRLMREQIMEVHMQFRRAHGAHEGSAQALPPPPPRGPHHLER